MERCGGGRVLVAEWYIWKLSPGSYQREVAVAAADMGRAMPGCVWSCVAMMGCSVGVGVSASLGDWEAGGGCLW